MDEERYTGTTIPHSSFGDPDCCGCLNGVISGDCAYIVCNECGVIIRTVPAAELHQTFAQMELTLDLCSAICSHCGSTNLFPGFSHITAFTCKECGEAVRLLDDPDVERFS